MSAATSKRWTDAPAVISVDQGEDAINSPTPRALMHSCTSRRMSLLFSVLLMTITGLVFLLCVMMPVPLHASANDPLSISWSSVESDKTESVAWGDYDGDGDLDLAVGNLNQPVRLYRNDSGMLTPSAVWSSIEVGYTSSVAWGDYDGDGDLDLAVGNLGQPNWLYRNDDEMLTSNTVWSSVEADSTESVAWGDVDGDGDLDLAVGNFVQPNRLYRNDDKMLTSSAIWSSIEADSAEGVAWGDVDNDGDLDLAVGNYNAPDRLYRNDGGTLTSSAIWSSVEGDSASSVAWGDVDSDGDLDLAIGNVNQPTRLHRNDGGVLTPSAIWCSAETQYSESIAWGDVDSDGDLDLAVGNNSQPIRLYRNDNGLLSSTAVWSSVLSEGTRGVAWGDVDGDGDLDLAVGNYDAPNRLYLNDGGPLITNAVWSSVAVSRTRSVAWGDADNDGDLDLAVGNVSQSNQLYRKDDGTLTSSAAWSSVEADITQSVAWGDVDADGNLDLAVGNSGQPVRLYRNDVGMLSSSTIWSSIEAESRGIAWGDVDSDGDLDLAVAAWDQPNRLYHNDDGMLAPSAIWSSVEADRSQSVAWGDVDGDGDLDLAVGNVGQPNRLYSNDGGVLIPIAAWSSVEVDYTNSVTWGDVDSDGDLDLAVGNLNQPTRLYRNDGGILTPSAAWWSVESDYSASVVWGDYDGDGDLDLVVGNNVQNRLYRNDGGTLTSSAAWSSVEADYTNSVAWGDVDDDGDLDLAVGNVGQNRLYRNGRDGGLLPGSVPVVRLARPGPNADGFSDPQIWSGVIPITYTLSHPQGNAVRSIHAWYSPSGGGQWLPAIATSNTITTGLPTFGSALSFDGVDDYVTTTNLVGLPGGNVSHTVEAWVKVTNLPEYRAWLLVLGDPGFGAHHWLLNSDGTAQLGVWDDGGQTAQLHPVLAPGVWTHVAMAFDGTTLKGYVNGQLVGSVAATFDLQGVPLVLAQQHAGEEFFAGVMDEVRVWNVARTQAQIQASMDHMLDGNQPGLVSYWRFNEAQGIKAFDQSPNRNSATLVNGPLWSIVESSYVYYWDTFASGVFGRSDNVVFRIQAVPAVVTGTRNAIPGPYLYGAYASQTFPFRVRGTQVRVLSETITGTVPISNAIVYRLPAGQAAGGAPLADNAGTPFHTDGQGYLQGRGQIGLGDQLLALAPVDWTRTITWAEGLTGTLRLYYTNGRPTPTGIEAFTVTEPGVQALTVSAAHPLALFDLDVSLEWDARNDPIYLQQLALDLQKASQYLYDFTDGQVALGQVTVHQNGDWWLPAHVAVQASNRLQPFAVQGGIVFTSTVDPQQDITYDMGQVRMGTAWNRYGEPGQGQGLDWQLALAHELGHLLLFQDDVYLGLDDRELLIPVDTCTGSAMGDVYLPDNTEFVYDQGHWTANCADTLANRTLHRTEWQTLGLWYPWLASPAAVNSGPSRMPFDLTTVRILEPITPTNLLDDPTFYVDYAGGDESSSGARAFLFHEELADVEGYDYVIELGSPAVGEQNWLLARGAQPGDRLCVYDPGQHQYGCEVIEPGDNRLLLEQDEAWTPIIRLSPVTSQTLDVEVAGLPPTLTLQARLYPEYEFGSDVITLTHEAGPWPGGAYRGRFELDYPPLAGHVQVWIDEEATETEPRREAMVAYVIGGEPGGTGERGPLSRSRGPLSRSRGPLSRSRGPLSRSRGPLSRSRGAPVASLDRQMIFFTAESLVFEEGQLFAINSVAALPPLPEGKKAIGPGYSLDANVPQPLVGSISFQYLSIDVLAEGADEDELAIHFWDIEQSRWQSLDTALDTYYNMASAPSQGSGVYALLAGATIPYVEAVNPPAATNDVTTTLTISGGYFLEPVEVALVGPTATYTLPLLAVSPYSLTALVAPGLPAREYQVVITNRYDGSSPTPGTFALYRPAYGACFYDYFESGAGRWQLGGDWAIAILPDGERAVTDSPAGNYDNAIPPAGTHTTAITSAPFSLAGCPAPVLTFRHDYVIARLEPSVDVGRVEISGDDGASWSVLASYSGGGIYPPLRGPEDVPSPEWANVEWEDVRLSLDAYTGTVRLRFALEVDQTVSDKGWVIDDVLVRTAPSIRIHLPLVLKASP